MSDGRGIPISYGERELSIQYFTTLRKIADESFRIPMVHTNKLDEALEYALQDERARPLEKHFQFTDERTGRRCVQLPFLLAAASESFLIEPYADHTHRFRISKELANTINKVHQIYDKEAMEILAQRTIEYLQKD